MGESIDLAKSRDEWIEADPGPEKKIEIESSPISLWSPIRIPSFE